MWKTVRSIVAATLVVAGAGCSSDQGTANPSADDPTVPGLPGQEAVDPSPGSDDPVTDGPGEGADGTIDRNRGTETPGPAVGDDERTGNEPVDGEPVDGEPVDGEPVDGEPVDGEPTDGEPPEEIGQEPQGCDDQNPCTANSWDDVAGECVVSNAADGTLCDADGDGCTASDECFAGTCEAGAPVACPAAEGVCQTSACSSTGPESFVCVEGPALVGAACDDTISCTQGDTCSAAGTCKGGSLVPGCCAVHADCDDGDACTVDKCDPAALTCTWQQAPIGTPCDADDDGCTVSDQCAFGECVAGPAVLCPSGGDCTVGSCTSMGPDSFECQVALAPAGAACDDGTPCWVATYDGAGGCSQLETEGCCESNADCSDDNACTADECDPDLLTCQNPPLATGSACDDDDACTVSDTCIQGACASGLPALCDDLDPCTADVCDPTKGCGHEAIGGCSPLQIASQTCFFEAAPGETLDVNEFVTGGFGPRTWAVDPADGGVAPPGTKLAKNLLTIPAIGVAGTFGFTVLVSDVTGTVRVPIAVIAPVAPNELWSVNGVPSSGPLVLPPGAGVTVDAGATDGSWVCSGNSCSACSHLQFEHLSWLSQAAVGITSDCDAKCGPGQFCAGLGETGVCHSPDDSCPGGCGQGHSCSNGQCYATALDVSELVPTNPGAGFGLDTDMVHQVTLTPGWGLPTGSLLAELPWFWLTFRMQYTISAPVPCDPSNPDLVAVRSVLVRQGCQ